MSADKKHEEMTGIFEALVRALCVSVSGDNLLAAAVMLGAGADQPKHSTGPEELSA